MATLTTSNAPYNSTNAIFQAWGSGIDGAFTTFGWIRTSDTGQINWTTVPFPTIVNTSQGYSIFRMSDSLQGTYPCYIKIEYGSYTAVLNPSLWITIGTGSDGAGNITGILKARLPSSSETERKGSPLLLRYWFISPKITPPCKTGNACSPAVGFIYMVLAVVWTVGIMVGDGARVTLGVETTKGPIGWTYLLLVCLYPTMKTPTSNTVNKIRWGKPILLCSFLVVAVFLVSTSY